MHRRPYAPYPLQPSTRKRATLNETLSPAWTLRVKQANSRAAVVKQQVMDGVRSPRDVRSGDGPPPTCAALSSDTPFASHMLRVLRELDALVEGAPVDSRGRKRVAFSISFSISSRRCRARDRPVWG